MNCTSEPSHPASHLSWEMNKVTVTMMMIMMMMMVMMMGDQVPVEEDNVIFRETVHNGKKLFVTRIGLRIRLTRDHFHWGKLKVCRYCVDSV